MAHYPDLTLAIRVDPNGDYNSVTSTSISTTTQQANARCYSSIDYWGIQSNFSWTLDYDLIFSGASAVNASGRGLALSDIKDSDYWQKSPNGVANAVGSTCNNPTVTTQFRIFAQQITNGVASYSASYITLNQGTQGYLRYRFVHNVGTYGTFYIGSYTNAARTTLIGSEVSVALAAAHTWRYLLPTVGFGSPTGTANYSGTTSNVYLNGIEPPHFTVDIAETYKLTDSINSVIPYTPSITETYKLADSISVAIPYVSLISESYKLSDTISLAQLFQPQVTIAETYQLRDTVLITTQHLELSITETYKLHDSTAAQSLSILEPIMWVAPQPALTEDSGKTDITYRVMEMSSGKFLDFADGTFKASGWITIAMALTEMAGLAAYYQHWLSVTNFDGYYAFIFYSPTSLNKPESFAQKYSHGQIVLGGLTFSESYILAQQTNVMAQTSLNVATVLTQTDTLEASVAALPSAAENAVAVGSRVVEGTFTANEVLRLLSSAMAGKVSGAGTGTEIFRDLSDTKPRVTFTTDANGNRTAVVRDVT